MKRWLRRLGVTLFCVLALAVIGALAARAILHVPETPTAEELRLLEETFGPGPELGMPRHPGWESSSQYLTMRDGVRIAITLILPKGLKNGETIPAIVRPTRYWRQWNLRWPLGWFLGEDLYTRLFSRYGYALVDVDARGSGASFGTRSHPWSDDELEDYREVLDWITAQPWSSGQVGATGVSYGGTCAEFMAALGHPALKAVVIRFSLHDAYADIAFPGGVFNRGFVEAWARFNNSLDKGEIPDELPGLMRWFVLGPEPVQGHEQELEKALVEHSLNVDIAEAAAQAEFRDDMSTMAGSSVDGFSPHMRTGAMEEWNGSIMAIGGWFDGAYAESALKRYLNVANADRVIIGPWNHGAEKDSDPYKEEDAPMYPERKILYLEQLRFFEHHLRGREPGPEPGVIYYTLGRGVWEHTLNWPPQGVDFFGLQFGPDRSLVFTDSGGGVAEQGEERVLPDPEAGTGELNRWRTQLGRSDVVYPPDFGTGPGYVYFTSAPLERDVLFTGSARAVLSLSPDKGDGAVFAYLAEVDENDGREVVRVLSEGCLRLAQARLDDQTLGQGPGRVGPAHTFLRDHALDVPPGVRRFVDMTLLPVSALVKKGKRLRLILACGDKDQFAPVPGAEENGLTVHWGGDGGSFLLLPERNQDL